MATHKVAIGILSGVPILNGADFVFFEPSSVKDTNDFYPHMVAVYNDTATKIGLRLRFQVPDNYVGTASVLIRWRSTQNTNAVVWDVDYRAIAAGETADPTTDQENATATDNSAGTAMFLNDCSVSLTSSNFAAGDLVLMNISRDGTDAADTMTVAAIVEEAFFVYADA